MSFETLHYILGSLVTPTGAESVAIKLSNTHLYEQTHYIANLITIQQIQKIESVNGKFYPQQLKDWLPALVTNGIPVYTNIQYTFNQNRSGLVNSNLPKQRGSNETGNENSI